MATADTETTKNYDGLVTIVNQSSDEENDQNETNEKLKRGQNKKYKLTEVFTTLEKAIEYVTSLSIWRRAWTRTSNLGKKYLYSCNLTTKRGKQCSTGLYIVLPANDLKYEIYVTECEHDHVEKKIGVTEETGEYIKKIYQLGTKKPKAIINQIEKINRENLERNESNASLPVPLLSFVPLKQLKVPLIKDLNNYLVGMKKKICGKSTMHLGELAEWCLKNCIMLEDTEENQDKPFVVCYRVKIDDEEPIVWPVEPQVDLEESPIEEDEDGDQFRFFYTTLALIKNSTNCKIVIQTDGTYKIVWQGNPLLLIGTSDFDRVFHPLGLSLNSREAHGDFKFLFNGLVKAREMLNLEPLNNISLMADNAVPITNGFEESYLKKNRRGNCWFHVKNNLQAKLNSVEDTKIRAEIIADLYLIQLCQTPDIFTSAIALFFRKWEEKVEDNELENSVIIFLKYFDTNYVKKNSNWFEGWNHPFNAGAASTNNGNEAINAVIKKEDTLRALLSLPEFLKMIEELVRKWSYACNPKNLNYKPFATEPSVKLPLWTQAYQWKKTAILKQLNEKEFYVSSSEGVGGINLSKDVLKLYDDQMKRCNWRSFESFANCAFGYWKISFNDPNWKLATCTCPIYYKKYICKHIVGIAMMQKLTNACPNHTKNVPFNTRRRAGRPQLAPVAFIRATNFTSLLEIEDDAELGDEALYDNNLEDDLNENEEVNRQFEPQFDTITSGIGDSNSSGIGDSESHKSSENSLLPHDGINLNHISIIPQDHFDPHFNEFVLQYDNFFYSNSNSTATTASNTYTNHLQSLTDHNFVNDISTARSNFNFQPTSSSLPSTYDQLLPVTNAPEISTIIPLVTEAAAPSKKRGRRPLSDETKAIREQEKKEKQEKDKQVKQEAKRAKLDKKK